ncbi:unnamed protein product [Rotaria sordida]|uniref:Apple domain-containing protein n=1 Tax=Rotaria sordida TaxID=392033 RepID=A0A815IG51_9BILA|nr:unnamed protein product [Rotaria sordida]CAF1367881.1 unnamed protein product [Rotaria sordida]
MLIITIIFLKLLILVTHQQQYKVRFQLTPFGIEFQYGNINDLYSNRLNVPSITRCAMICSMEKICQTFDYDASSHVCRLFSIWADQGTFVPSTSSTSRVGYVQQTTELYSLYQKSCNISHDINRYLSCTDDGLWTCQTGQVYNGTVCQYEDSYSYTTVSYEQECRQNQTMQWNGTHCLPAITNSFRWNASGITVAGTTAVSDCSPQRLNQPSGVIVDSDGTIYVSDQYNHRIQKWIRGATNGITVAGQANCTAGSGAAFLLVPQGAVVDSNANLYVADIWNHRVQLWPNGAYFGITIAGTG